MILGVVDHQGAKPAALQRAQGRALVSVGLSRGQSRLVDLAQAGSARVMLPRSLGPRPEAVFLNTAGGLTSGDRLGFAMSVGAGAALTATTQTAERAYLAVDGPARLTIRAEVAAGATLDWLPQETILFQGSDLSRETQIDLGPGASCLLVEIVTLGRRAMGEVVTKAQLTDRRTVTAQGQPLHIEALRLTPESLRDAGSPAVLGSNSGLAGGGLAGGGLAHVFASLGLCGAGAEAAVEALRALPRPEGVRAAVSGWNGRCLLRATGTDLWPLKLYLGRVMARLTDRPLPRVWQMQGVA
ncbi:urease accessory protein UreD [Tabrizicola sp.]|uniref:urease accessory protein UreD n=1 Tax=Tabrizicola sp. TaxID=2005166 RepID=UPI003D29CD71